MAFAFLIFLLKIISIKTISKFKVIQSSNCNNFFIVMSDGIYYFNNINYNMVNIYEFNSTQIIESQDQFDSISLKPLLNNSFLFVAKNNYIYFFDEKENEIKCISNSLKDIEIYSSQIIPYDIYKEDDYFSFKYFIILIDTYYEFNIYHYSMVKNSSYFKNEEISSLHFYIDSEYFSCQYFLETITCFYRSEYYILLEANFFILFSDSEIK